MMDSSSKYCLTKLVLVDTGNLTSVMQGIFGASLISQCIEHLIKAIAIIFTLPLLQVYSKAWVYVCHGGTARTL